jgi:hypothetical protein
LVFILFITPNVSTKSQISIHSSIIAKDLVVKLDIISKFPEKLLPVVISIKKADIYEGVTK